MVLRAASGDARWPPESEAAGACEADRRGAKGSISESPGRRRGEPDAVVAPLKKPDPRLVSAAGGGAVRRNCGARLACRTLTGRPSSDTCVLVTDPSDSPDGALGQPVADSCWLPLDPSSDHPIRTASRSV